MIWPHGARFCQIIRKTDPAVACPDGGWLGWTRLVAGDCGPSTLGVVVDGARAPAPSGGPAGARLVHCVPFQYCSPPSPEGSSYQPGGGTGGLGASASGLFRWGQAPRPQGAARHRKGKAAGARLPRSKQR